MALRKIYRWITLIEGMYLMMIAGAQFAYGSYSTRFSTLGFEQGDLDLIGALTNVGTYVSTLPFGTGSPSHVPCRTKSEAGALLSVGLLIGKIGLQKGPRVVMAIAFLCEFLGSILAWLVASYRIVNVPAWGFALIYLLIGFAGGGCITVALVVNARNFLMEDRGKVRYSSLWACFFGNVESNRHFVAR
jgi:MFS family permease